jgi:site-specific DNA recombinase
MAFKIVAAHWRPGPLAHLLKNRFYVGEIAYRGEIHKGEHEAIVDRSLFEAAQTRLSAQVVVRTTANKASSSFLKGLLFDDAGHAMSPSHANKKGIRYRYYVSQAVLQGRATEAGSVTRVSAPDAEQLVLASLQASGRADGLQVDEAMVRDLVARVVVEAKHLVVHLHQPGEIGDGSEERVATATELKIPFTPKLRLRKGVAHAPRSAVRLSIRNPEKSCCAPSPGLGAGMMQCWPGQRVSTRSRSPKALPSATFAGWCSWLSCRQRSFGRLRMARRLRTSRHRA